MNFCLLFFAFFASAAFAADVTKGKAKKFVAAKKANDVVVDSSHFEKEFNETKNDNDDEKNNKHWCYESSWAFKCRQTSPVEYELECKIAHVEGDPCFPNLVKMINYAAPLVTISYPIHLSDALSAAKNITPISMITWENIERLTLIGPFDAIPADAFCKMPNLTRVTLESLDGVKNMTIHRDAFRNSNVTRIHFVGYDVRSIVEQKIDWLNFTSVTFSDVRLQCDCREKNKNSTKTTKCERMFENMRNVQELNIEKIHVRGTELDDRMFYPMWDTLKSLSLDVVYEDAKKTLPSLEKKKKNDTSEDDDDDEEEEKSKIKYRGYFPVETFAFMNRLEEMYLYLYEPIFGLSVRNETTLPLPVSKTLQSLDFHCRYCKSVDVQHLGKMMPNLHRLTIDAPWEQKIINESCLETLTKLKKLIINDCDIEDIKEGTFKRMTELKILSIKYAPIKEMNVEHFDGLENVLESLTLSGTKIRHVNVSRLERLTELNLSGNRIETFERDLLPKKAEFWYFDISHNPIKRLERGFLKGVAVKKGALRLNGMDFEKVDLNVIDGMKDIRTLDLTQNMKLREICITDRKELPADLERVVVGRSPLLKLNDTEKCISNMMRERNITLVIEGVVACTCEMRWMLDIRSEYPQLFEIHPLHAICDREYTDVAKMPETFWKKPTVVNFLKMIKEEKAVCKTEEKLA